MLEEYRKDFNAKGFITKLRYNEELRNELIEKTSFLPEYVTLSERMYYWYNNINEQLLCPHCGKPRKFRKFTYGYFPTCGSKECRAKSVVYGNKYSHDYVAIQKKMKETYASKHNGIEHNMQDPEFLKTYIIKKKQNTVKRYLDKYEYSIIEQNGEFYDIQCNKCKRIFKNIYGDLITYNLYRNKHFCDTCYDTIKTYTTRSKFEDSVYQYVLSICGTKEKIIANRKVGKEFYIYDIVLYDKHFVIECNGIYYHSELCTLDNNYHYKKMKNANDADYDVLTIWQDDWYSNNEKEKLKILRYIKPQLIELDICSFYDNCFNYNNQTILKLNVNENVIKLEYKSHYTLIHLYDYLKKEFNGYLIEHDLDYPLEEFEKQLEIKGFEEQIYYLDGHKKIKEIKECLAKIYSTGKIYLKI